MAQPSSPSRLLTPEIITCASTLVRIPSQAGLDDPTPILTALEGYARELGLPAERLTRNGAPVGLLCSIGTTTHGPQYCLNACADTAPVGAEAAWATAPFSGTVADGWLHGRGAADSKIAVAMFLHLAALMARDPPPSGGLHLLIDTDEHSGNFGGIRAFLDRLPRCDGVLIGYPGDTHLMIGARGFFRPVITLAGAAAHSGSSIPQGVSALTRGIELVARLEAAFREVIAASTDHPPPKLTITELHAGEGFSSVPSLCRIGLDIRTTSSFSTEHARTLVAGVVEEFERTSALPRSRIESGKSWDAYALPPGSRLRTVFLEAATRHGYTLNTRICGPSNIGNLLAHHGVEATCGFGVPCQNLHGADERADVTAVPRVFGVYLDTVSTLLRG